MKKTNNSTLIGLALVAALAAVGFYLIKTYKSISRNSLPEFCQASSSSWQTPEQCASEQGHYIAADSVCKDEKWLGNKSNADQICCVNCTSDTIIDNG